MAFIDFSLPGIAAAAIAADAQRADAACLFTKEEQADEATLSPLEWSVVMLARTDRLHTLRDPGRFDRLFAFIFGEPANPRLASKRLEALRRLAVEAWHRGYAVSLSALSAFTAAGFTKAQLELLLATISAGRAARGRRSFA